MYRCLLLTLLLTVSACAKAQSIAGAWDATVTNGELVVPFVLELTGQGTAVHGALVNGDDKFPSTSGRFENGVLELTFAHFAAKLEATFQDGRLEGVYKRGLKVSYAFAARRPEAAHTGPDAPSIAGLWQVQVDSPKGEAAWHLIVKQTGGQVRAAILRVDGDTGTLAGKYADGKFRLSHFAGGTPYVIDVTPQKDGTLELVRNNKDRWIAYRPEEARSKGLAGPEDPMRHSSVKDPSEPFQFKFPDVHGKMVSNTDERFRDKVVIVALSGSWCPNCHDEAPFLMELYRKYHAQGLEIVALSFEEPEEQKDLSRLRAFINQYGIEYPVLMPGEPNELQTKLPQLVNVNSWPTSFFLGRDGRVRSIHAGFAGPASGDFHRQQKEELTSLVERLLAERTVTSR